MVCYRDEDVAAVRHKVYEAFLDMLGRSGEIRLDIEPVHAITPEKSGKIRSVISHCSR